MRFTIEVVSAIEGGRESILHRTAIDEISPRRAKTKADQLWSAWRGRGADSVRVLNPHGEELYSKS